MAELQIQGVPFLKLNGGLNSSGSPLNMEPTDSADILNADLNLSGSFSWRRAIDFLGEPASETFFHNTTISQTPDGEYEEIAPSFAFYGVTKSTGEFTTYVVVHVGYTLRIYDFSSIWNLIDIDSPYQTLDLTAYADSTMPFSRSVFSIDRNKLFMVNAGCTPGYVYLDTDTTFDFAPLTIATREPNATGATPDSYVANDSKQYLCIKAHTSAAANEPGTGADWQVYWVQFGPAISGATAWGLGNAYVTNVTTIAYKFNTMCFAGSRMWLAGYPGEPNTLYYSQTITDDLKIGRMYQFADPLNADDSAAVDTDGGNIIINGTERVLSISEFQNGILVFASNGVWYIGGTSVNDAFTPTAFSLNRVSDSGIIGKHCFCKVEDMVMYMGQGAIYVITKEDLYGKVKAKSISEKVETFYNTIPAANRANSVMQYNQSEKKLYIWTNFKSYYWTRDWNPMNEATHMRDALILDLQVKGWTVYSLEDDPIGNRLSIGAFVPTTTTVASADVIVDNSGRSIVDDSVQLVEALTGTETNQINLILLHKRYDSKSSVAFGRTDALGSVDFSLHVEDDIITETSDTVIDNSGLFVVTDADDYEYPARMVTAPQIFGNLSHWKQNPYVVFIFDRTETGIIDDTTDADITAGGCMMTILHDWVDNDRSSVFQTARQVYRPNRITLSRYDGSATGDSKVVVKERIRGRARALQFKFEKDGSKPCELFGMQVGVSASARAY